MITDVNGSFANQQSLTGTAAQISTNVYNAGSAKKLFQGGSAPAVKCSVQLTAVGGTNPTFRGQFVGADDAALTSNVEVLADTGTSAVLGATDLPVLYELTPGLQKNAKQYYGMIFTQGGTAPTATVNSNLVRDSQSNLLK